MNVVYPVNNNPFSLPSMTFGQRLKEAREEAGLSQTELGRRVGLTQQAIGAMENMRNARQGSKHVPLIADALSVKGLWLARGQGPKRNDVSTFSAENGHPGSEKEDTLKIGLPKIIEGLCIAFTEDAVRAALSRYEEKKARQNHPTQELMAS